MDAREDVCGYVLDGNGGGRPIDWSAVSGWSAEQGTLWLVLSREDDRVRRWLTEDSRIDRDVVDGLLASVSRPRVEVVAEGLLLIVRCVDPAPEAEPQDLISIRIWAEPHRVVVLRREQPRSIEDIEARVAQGRGPRTPGQLVGDLVGGITDRLVSVVEDVEESTDELEDKVVDPSVAVDRTELADLRHRIIGLHRYVLPQVQALMQIQTNQTPVLRAEDRRVLMGAANRSMRCVEDLDAARNRAAVIQDELANQLTARMNRRIYVVTVFAAIFLPLTLITGLLGVNLGGIPGADSPYAFAALCLLLTLFGVLGYWLVRRFRLL